jgi:ParB family chromosome partitioning protein
MHALSVYKSDLSNMLSVAHRIPEDLSDAIGPAPKAGRRVWIDLADRIKSPKLLETARKAATAPGLQTLDSDERLKAVVAAVTPAPIKSKIESLQSARGEKFAKVASNAQRVVVTVDRKRAPEFADYVLSRMNDLITDFEKRRGEGTS